MTLYENEPRAEPGTLRETLLLRIADEVGPVGDVADPVLGGVTIARRLASSAVA